MRSETTTRRLLAVGLAVGTLALGIASLGASQQEARTSGEYPQVGADFLTALEREIGPHRGGRAPAVVGDLVFYFGASHGGVWKNRGALVGNTRTDFLADEPSHPMTPDADPRYNIDPTMPNWKVMRELGLTTYLITPGNTPGKREGCRHCDPEWAPSGVSALPKSASLPTSMLPMWASMSNISAALSVSIFRASCSGTPLRKAQAALRAGSPPRRPVGIPRREPPGPKNETFIPVASVKKKRAATRNLLGPSVVVLIPKDGVR